MYLFVYFCNSSLLKKVLLLIRNHVANTKTLGVEAVALLSHVFSLYANSWQATVDAKREKEMEKESLYKYKSQTHGTELTEEQLEEIEIRQTFPSFDQVPSLILCL